MRGIFKCTLLIAALLVATPATHAQDALRDQLTHPIHSLLLEKEVPLLGLLWSGQLLVDTPLGNEPDGAQTTLRLARVKFHRSLGSKWQIKLSGEYNTNGNFEFNDSYAVFTGWETYLVKLGVSKPPFSLESFSGITAQTFLEEALPVAALSERRGGGIVLFKRTPKSILTASLMALNTRQDGLSNSGQALILHYVHSPIDFLGRKSVNLGGSLSYRVNTSGPDTQFRSKPEVATTGTYFVDTGEIQGASEVLRAGFEANQVNGRFSWQSEMLAARVARNTGSSVDFWGAYLYASWFLTDDTRNYDLGQGRFVDQVVNKPVFKGGKGAFELSARASHVDLEDKDILGGRETNVTLGLNWYLNNQVKLAGNVIKVLKLDRPGSDLDGTDPLIFAVRFQLLIR